MTTVDSLKLLCHNIDICSHNHKCECTTKTKRNIIRNKNEEVYIDIKLAIM